MGRKLTLEFELDRHIGLAAPAARFWVDLDRDGFEDKERVRGVVQEGLVWRGVVESDALPPRVFAFVRYVASAGARFTFRVRLGDKELHVEKGVVTSIASWVMIDVALPGGDE